MLFLSFIMVAVIAAVAFGQDEAQEQKKSSLYQWTDEKGVVHITDNPGNIPESYRSKAQKIEVPEEKESGEQYDRSAPERSTSRESGTTDEVEEDIRKGEWQDRIHDWKARLAEAERRYQELEKERSALFTQWGIPAYAPAEVRLKAEQLDRDMAEVQKKIDEARHMISEVIPEEARKAGVPPGWLRE
jgi:hypothetical protein